MKFTVEIEMKNSAFEADQGDGGSCPELARILATLASTVAEGCRRSPVRLRDINGNAVGTAEFIS